MTPASTALLAESNTYKYTSGACTHKKNSILYIHSYMRERARACVYVYIEMRKARGTIYLCIYMRVCVYMHT